MRRVVFVLVAWCVCIGTVQAAPQTEPPEWVTRLKTWSTAVDTHRPGERDDAVIEMASWAHEDVLSVVADYRALNAVVRRGALRGRSFEIEHKKTRMLTDDLQAFAMFRSNDPHVVNRMLRRAAMLHADVALLAPLDWSRSTGPPDSAKVLDGVIVGYDSQSAHWIAGRDLLDDVTPTPSADRFVALWYYAAAAAFLEDGNLSAAKPHLERGVEVLPTDPNIRFELGYYHQASVAPAIAAAVRAQEGTRTSSRRGGRYGIDAGESLDSHRKSARKALAEAVALDADHAEARLRLAHELLDAGRLDEAATHLRTAAAASKDKTLSYLILLLLGQAEERLGQRDEAEQRYTQAGALFPEARAPRLARAALVRSQGERDRAWTIVTDAATEPIPQQREADPWWSFFRWQAQSSKTLFARVREMARTGGGQ